MATADLVRLGTADPNPPWKVYDLYTDHLGSVRLEANNSTVIALHDYLPFGEEIAPMLDFGTHMFTGHERDGESGLDYMMARYYGSSLARFLSVDPVVRGDNNLRIPQRWNRYAYALGNPLTLLDPDGRDVVYADQYSQDLMHSARSVSPGTEKVLSQFEADHSKTLRFQTGDVPDEANGKKIGSTKTTPPKNGGDKPTEFEVTFDAKDLAATGVSEIVVAIHEVVGHVKANSERSFDETIALTPEQRESDAQDATAEDVGKIPEADRPELPANHKQPPSGSKKEGEK